MQRSTSARLSVILHVIIVGYNLLGLLLGGPPERILAEAFSALTWPSVLAALSFFEVTNVSGPLSDLARTVGARHKSLPAALFTARAWLVLRPFTLSIPLLWLASLAARGDARSLLLLPLGILGTLACASILALGASLLAGASELWSPHSPRRVLAALLLLPLLLGGVFPNAPDLLGFYRTTSSGVVRALERT